MGTLRVGHAKEVKKDNEVRLYVGRSSSLSRASDIDMSFAEFGNPYWMQDESKRQHVIDMYKTVIERVRNTERFQHFLRIVRELMDKEKDVVLVCWCHPKACHAKVLLDEVMKTMGHPQEV